MGIESGVSGTEHIFPSGEMTADAMADKLASQIHDTFTSLVEAGADEAALAFYSAAMNLCATFQPIRNRSTATTPTPFETVDL